MKPMTLSVIIVHYKVQEKLFNCLESIFNLKPNVNFEVVVVNNDEKDGLKKNLKRKFPYVNYIKAKKNLGYGGGNNLGVKYSKGEYLFFLNPDTELLPDALESLLEFIKNKNNIGAVSPLLLDENNEPNYVQGSQFVTSLRAIFALSIINKIFPNNIVSRKFFLKDWGQNKPRRVDVFPGTAFLIKKTLFEKLGKFDEKYFLFFEEADLARRIKKNGLDNYIVPKAKIIHFGGVSTKQRVGIKEIYNKSQFYYFKKWYGLPWAIIINLFTSIGKYEVLLFFIFTLALFLRTFRLNETMIFIGDQGWFYLSARDMLLTGKIPLVGITSSHIWLHQGPYWTYILAFLFKFIGYNPLIPGYFTAIFGSLSIFIVYKIIKEMFGKKIGVISSLLYATSPLILINDRFPYHTSLIPIFTLLYIFSIYKWVKGEVKYFICAIILLGILYNFELATFSLGAVLLIFLFFGLLKRKSWVVNILNRRIILFSIVGFTAVMFPVLIYDIKNGFLQTFGFLIWILYKIVRIPLNTSTSVLGGSTNIFHFLLDRYKLLTFANSFLLSVLFLFSSFVIFLYLLKKEKTISLFIVTLSFIIVIFGFVINKTPSDAYLPIFFPIVIVISAIFWNFIIKKTKIFSLIMLLIFAFINSYYLLNYYSDLAKSDLAKRKEAVSRINEIVSGRKYNLIGKGIGSQFESFTMNYEYLLWLYYKSEPAKKPVELKVFIEEKNGKILVNKND